MGNDELTLIDVYDAAVLETATPVPVNQTSAPNDVQSTDGRWWESLGQYAITGGSLKVELTDRGNGQYACADGVWIRYVGPAGPAPDWPVGQSFAPAAVVGSA